MLEKMILSDKECEYLAKSIAGGVLIGLALGAIFNNPQFGFAFRWSNWNSSLSYLYFSKKS